VLLQQVAVKLNRDTMSTIEFTQEMFSEEKHARTSSKDLASESLLISGASVE
jgi:hypothetical protein